MPRKIQADLVRKLQIPDFKRPAENEYYCSKCLRKCVKLWRHTGTRMLEGNFHYCGICAQIKMPGAVVGTIDSLGQSFSKRARKRTDCIGSMVPAIIIPGPQGDLGYFYAYTDIPAEGMEWWRSLPL